MKRTFTTIVCALLLVAMLAGCGSTGSTNPFDAKAKTFSDDGMQITLTTAFSEEDLEGYTVGYAADTAIVLALHETKAEFADAGAEDVTFEQYVEFVKGANEDKAIVDGEPIDGNPTLLYDFLNEEQNVTYRYLTVLYESDDGFWMVQFASQKSNFDAYEPSFIEAAKSVSFSAGISKPPSGRPPDGGSSIAGTDPFWTEKEQTGYACLLFSRKLSSARR